MTDGNGEKIQVARRTSSAMCRSPLRCPEPLIIIMRRHSPFTNWMGRTCITVSIRGDNIHYQNSRSANIKTILDGVPDAAETSAAPKPEEHIRFPEPYTQTIRHDCGTKAGVQEYIDQLNVYLYDDVIDAWDYIKGVSAWNDLVEIDGTKYLDDAVVTHANDTRKVRDSQGSAFKTEGH